MGLSESQFVLSGSVDDKARVSGRRSGFSVRRYLDEDQMSTGLDSIRYGFNNDDVSPSQVITNLRNVRMDIDRSQHARLVEQMCDVREAEDVTQGSDQRRPTVNCVWSDARTYVAPVFERGRQVVCMIRCSEQEFPASNIGTVKDKGLPKSTALAAACGAGREQFTEEGLIGRQDRNEFRVDPSWKDDSSVITAPSIASQYISPKCLPQVLIRTFEGPVAFLVDTGAIASFVTKEFMANPRFRAKDIPDVFCALTARHWSSKAQLSWHLKSAERR